jgi:signal transduction histidine kinase
VNVAKHANATEADVTLEYDPTQVRLTIHDNGVGWDGVMLNGSDPLRGPGDGFGLLGMRERIQQWGGTLALSNQNGARVEARIPRERAERAGNKGTGDSAPGVPAESAARADD